MKKVKRIPIILAAFVFLAGVVGALAVGSAPDGQEWVGLTAGVSGQPASVKDKDEVVYARLSENGIVKGIYVVNHFTLLSGGVITDHGDYTAAVNLTDLQPVALADGTVTVQTDSENFYYQGYIIGDVLPWLYSIEYFLDGEPAGTEELAGKSGRLEIRMKSAKNTAVNDVFFNNYMQQITIALDGDKCADIAADGASAANAGRDRMFVFTVLPKQNADIVITANVRDFEMAGIDIAAMPFSMSFDLPDMRNIRGNLGLLVGAIAELRDGIGALNDGAYELADGSAMLRQGAFEFYDGLSQLSENSLLISDASEQINSALALIAAALTDSEDIPDIGMLTRLPDVLDLLTGALRQVFDAMKQLEESYKPAYDALDSAVSAIPGYQIGEPQTGSLYSKADDDERELLDRLIENYMAAQAVKEVYSQAKPVLASVTVTLDSLSAMIDSTAEMLGGISALIGGALSDYDIIGQLGELTEGLSELSRNYAVFHSGLVTFMLGVSEAAAGYSELYEGITGLGRGAEGVARGIGEVYGGTTLLADEVSDIPAMVDTMIDDIASSYSGAGFEPVSFTSDKNSDTGFVQFVFKTDGISIPPEVAAPSEAVQLNFWDRLMKLFGK